MAVLAWKPKTDILVGRTGNMFVFFSIWESTYDYFGPNIVGTFPATGKFSVFYVPGVPKKVTDRKKLQELRKLPYTSYLEIQVQMSDMSGAFWWIW